MSKHTRTTSEKPLSKKQKRQLDRLLENLGNHLETPEGAELLNHIEDLFSTIHARHEPQIPALTAKEERALKFIREQLHKGHSPSVREVARSVNLRSSRSGSRIVNALICKGFLERKKNSARHVLIAKRLM